MSSPVIAVQNQEELRKEVVPKEKLLVLGFMGSVSYRSTCEYMKPILDSIAKAMDKDKVEFRTIDVDNNEFKDIVRSFKVEALPAFLMIKEKTVVKRIVTTNKQELTNSIRAAI